MLKRHQIVECVVTGVCDALDIKDWRTMQFKKSNRSQFLSFARTVCATLLTEHLGCSFESTHHYFSMYGNIDSARRAKGTFREQIIRSVEYADYFRMAEFCVNERVKELQGGRGHMPIPKRLKFVMYSSKMNEDYAS